METRLAVVAKKAGGNSRPGAGLRSFSGSLATTGNSRGFRLETAFFKAAPEFSVPGGSIRADLIGPGTILVRVDTARRDEEPGDPIIGAWLSFIDRDIQTNPDHLVPFAERELSVLEKLVENVVVDDDYQLPDDVTF